MSVIKHISRLKEGIYTATLRTRYSTKGMEWALFDIDDQMVIVPIMGAPPDLRKGDTLTIFLWKDRHGITRPYLM